MGECDLVERLGFLCGGARPSLALICEYIDIHKEELGLVHCLVTAGVRRLVPSGS